MCFLLGWYSLSIWSTWICWERVVFTAAFYLWRQLHFLLPFRYWLACLQSVGWSITVGLFDFSFLTSSWISQSFLRGFFGKPKHLSAFLFAVLQKFFFYFMSVADLFVQCTRWGRPLFKYSLACKTSCSFLLNYSTSLEPIYSGVSDFAIWCLAGHLASLIEESFLNVSAHHRLYM